MNDSDGWSISDFYCDIFIQMLVIKFYLSKGLIYLKYYFILADDIQFGISMV